MLIEFSVRSVSCIAPFEPFVAPQRYIFDHCRLTLTIKLLKPYLFNFATLLFIAAPKRKYSIRDVGSIGFFDLSHPI